MAAFAGATSNKKEDLVRILEHMNIQVDNPVSLLDQDTSRHFLHSNNPTHKYKVGGGERGREGRREAVRE